MQNFATKSIAELKKTCASCAAHVGGSSVSFVRLVCAPAAAIAQIFKILHAKSRVFRPQLCALSVPNVRARRKRSALTHSKGFRRRAMHSCAFRNHFAGARRVLRAKTAPKLVETFAIRPKITVSECKGFDLISPTGMSSSAPEVFKGVFTLHPRPFQC